MSTKKSYNAEKQARYRAKRDADPTRRAEYLDGEKCSYRKKRETGKIKLASELTARQLRARRKQNKDNKRRQRAREKANQLNLSLLPPSPESLISPTSSVSGSASRFF